MKYILTLSALAAFTAAQGISDLPSCSLSCFASELPKTGCGLTDFKCSCSKADELTPVLQPCVEKACPSSDDQKKAIEVLSAICASAGVPITLPPAQPEQPSTPSTPAQPEPEKPSESAKPHEPETLAPSAAPESYPVKPTDGSCSAPVTVTVTASSGAPYPVTSKVPLGGTGTGYPVPTTTSPGLPEFTGAAAGMKVPAALAGVFGVAAMLF